MVSTSHWNGFFISSGLCLSSDVTLKSARAQTPGTAEADHSVVLPS
jgi:hypothetical protein